MHEHGDATTDAALATWVPVGDSDFPIQNLPYGAIVRDGETTSHLAVAIGDYALDLGVLARAGAFDALDSDARALLGGPSLDALIARDRATWRSVRAAISVYLRADTPARNGELAARALVLRRDARNVLPFTVGAYVDFYSSLEHATNLGRILRPGEEPLHPNWRWLPIGYHGRASTISCDLVVRRPHGQVLDASGVPEFAATRKLDYELELACITGNGIAGPSTAVRARESVFGLALLCDWSARDMQAWEYRPLGPFLSKSFATTIGPWIVSMDALEPFRRTSRAQDPPPLPHLAVEPRGAFDIVASVSLRSGAMCSRGEVPDRVADIDARGLYWTIGQQLAHVASNGTALRAGDVYASGTISGREPEKSGSLIERTRDGTVPLRLSDGTTRAYLEDGDEVTLTAHARDPYAVAIGFGNLCARVI
jgi:fumarylacetoacetase